MKSTAKIRYGLQLMLELALRHGQGPVLVPAIAKRQGLPAKYLHVILGSLKAAGLVRAQRGPTGGCELARPPAAISALEVIEALEGRPAPLQRSGGANVGEKVVHELTEASSAAGRDVLAGTTLAQLAARHQVLEVDSDAYSI